MTHPPLRKLRRGEPFPSADWFNSVVDAVESKTLLPSAGFMMVQTPSGVTLRAVQKPGAIFEPHFASCLTPKEIKIPSDKEKKIKLILHPARMAACDVHNANSMRVVSYNGTPIEADPAPEIELNDNEANEIWASWQTDANGAITVDDVTLQVGQPSMSQTHLPNSPEGTGIGGSYAQHIGTLTTPPVERRAKGVKWKPIAHVLIWNVFDRDMRNMGDGAEVAKEITANEMQFRTIIGEENSGIGTTHKLTIKVEQEGEDELKVFGEVTIPDGTVYINGSSYIHYNNGTDTIELANSNTANFSPKEGETGFFEYFCAVGGEVGHSLLYGTEPHALGSEGAEHVFDQATDHGSQQTSGGTS